MYRLLLLACLLAWSAGARAQGTFEVPCQSREAFVSRLRALVHVPAAADAALGGFHVQARALGPSDWLVTVLRTGESSGPRSVRDASCEAVVEAAALITALWIDEVPASAPAPAAPTLHMIVVDPPTDRSVGVSLLADASLTLLRAQPAGGLGSTLSLWLQENDEGFFQVGLRLWPTALRLNDTAANAYEQRGGWEVLLGVTGFWPRFGNFYLGAQFTIAMGPHASDERSGEVSYRPELGLVLRLRLAQAFYLRYQLGLAVWKDPVRLAAVSALGLDVLAFDL